MLGSASEAEDAVQEAWIRLTRSDASVIDNLQGWLTTVVARICLDLLRGRKTRREDSLISTTPDTEDDTMPDPESRLITDDAVAHALLIVLDQLSPSERVAFVLHDLFDIAFSEIALVLDRTEEATRQLASRARRRVRNAEAPRHDPERQQAVVEAFLAASRHGDFEGLMALLHPDIVLRADESTIQITRANAGKGAPQFEEQIEGAGTIANLFSGKAMGAQLALIDGMPGITWAPPGGKPMFAWCFALAANRVSAIDVIMDQRRLRDMHIDIISAPPNSNQ